MRKLRRTICGLCGEVISVSADAVCHRCARSSAPPSVPYRVVAPEHVRIPVFRDDPAWPLVTWMGPNDAGAPDWYVRGDEVPADFDVEQWQIVIGWTEEYLLGKI